MNSSNEREERLDTSAIGADIDEAASDDEPSEISRLRTRLSEVEAERDGYRDEVTVESQKARLLIPYSNKVYWFVVWFCIASLVVLLLCAEQSNGYDLPISVLSIISGSTMASVIGLLATIITGIFKSK